MRIDRLELRNFRGFESASFDFHPNFNLFVGENGSGKTSLLDAISVAAGAWLVGLSPFSAACRPRRIDKREIRLVARETLPKGGGRKAIGYEYQYPVVVRACGSAAGEELEWERTIDRARGNTTVRGLGRIRSLAADAGAAVARGEPIGLPLISHYGTGRVWNQPRDLKARRAADASKSGTSRFSGYANSHDPRADAGGLFRWLQRQEFVALEEGAPPPALKAVRKAVLACIEGGKRLRFSVKLADLVVETEEFGRQPFDNLSDGYRNMIAMVGDIARKAVCLNPHLGEAAPSETAGVVLVDELDLHLHPRWQRRVAGDLRKVFPRIQFFCTTHSPFLVQSIEPGELLRLGERAERPLDFDYSDASIEDIAEAVQGVELPQRGRRSVEFGAAARRYFSALKDPNLEPEKLKAAEIAYREASRPFTRNPGLNALLELEALARNGGKRRR